MKSPRVTLSLDAAEPVGGASSVRVSVGTEFIQDYGAGLPIGPQQAFRVVQDSNGSPMVFSRREPRHVAEGLPRAFERRGSVGESWVVPEPVSVDTDPGRRYGS